MKYFIISSLINAISCGFCCIFILINNYRSKAVRAFALFVCLVTLWSFFYCLSMIASHYDEAMFYSRGLNAWAIFIPTAFYYFCLQLTENNKSIFRNILKLSIILDILVALTVPTPLFIQTVTQVNIFPLWPIPGPSFFVAMAQFFILVPFSFVLLLNKFRASTGENRNLYKILIASLAIAFTGGGTNYFLCVNIPIAPYGNAFVVCFVIAVFFLIAKYQLLDIRIALSRSFSYTIIIFLITLSYFATTYLIEKNLKDMLGYKSFLLSFICAGITALAFIPLKDIIQSFVDKLFFKKTIKEIEHENELLKQEVAQSERLKSIAILASGIAHEIKNPLTPLKTFSEFLPQKLDDKEFLKKFTPLISQEITRIDKLVHELLEFAKPSPTFLKEANIQNILDDTLEYLSNDFIKSRINITKQYNTSNNIVLNLDSNQFRQALLNILLNAIDAMPHSGSLTLSTQCIKNDEFYQIKISDSGCGIDEKDITHIFDPFFTKKDGGTGLGLSITYEIIRKHNGKIFVESQKGIGTTFILELPIK